MNNTQSEGYDSVSTKVLKSCKDKLSSIIAYLVNFSLQSGTFPEKLKISVVKPLHKKNDNTDMGNYRPVTLISVFSKIFEKVMFDKLNSFFEKHHILNPNQYGFQKHKSTTHAAFNLISNVLKNINNKNFTTVLFLDLSKAFDLVNHELLLKKLELNGIRGPAQNWLKSYLTNRLQCVEINQIAKTGTTSIIHTYRSDLIHNNYGVPQGSIIGPLLFLLYINDLPDATNYKTILFADDISIIVDTDKTQTIEQHKTDISHTLKLIIDWLMKNNLQINLLKTKLMNFNNFQNHIITIDLEGHTLENTNVVTFLGLNINPKLTWKEQVEKVCSKLSRFAFALYKVTKVTNINTALSAYYAYVESIIRYGLLIWGNGADVQSVFVAQKSCIRAIFNIPPDVSCRPYFKSFNILTLPCIYILETATFVAQNKHLFVIAKNFSNRNIRNPNNLIINVAPNTSRFLRNCYMMSIKIYNKVPNSIKLLPPYKFKNGLRSWLLEHSFYSVKEYLNFK